MSEGDENVVSPFDEQIVELMQDQQVCIACPYLGLDYLKPRLGISRSWRILTDVEEWLASHGADQREAIIEFIREHSDRVRHCRDLHAKVVIADHGAIVGSANLTAKGIRNRIEVSVLFRQNEEEAQIEELRRWFDLLWERAEPVNIEQAEQYARLLPQESLTEHRPRSRLASPLRINARLSKLPERPHEHGRGSLREIEISMGEERAHMELVRRASMAPSRQWMDQYFDLIREVLDCAGLTNDDPRLSLTMPRPRGKGAIPTINVNVNVRYVLTNYLDEEGNVLGIIHDPSFEYRSDLWGLVLRYGRFEPLTRPEKAGAPTPFFLRLPSGQFPLIPEPLKQGWLQAVHAEALSRRGGPFRDHHQPVLYRAATDLVYRELVLNEAFPDEGRS
jgi:hypothetical protein